MFNAGTLAGVYRTPAIHVDITGVFTNTNPVRPYRGNGRPEAAYVIERMVDLAADELGHRSRRTAPAQLHSAERHAVQDRAHVHLRQRRVRKEHGSGARARRLQRLQGAQGASAQARQAARLRPVQHHRARRRRQHRRRRSALRPLRRGDTIFRLQQPGPGPRDRVQADWSATGSGSIPTRCNTCRATPTRCSTAKAPAARARRPWPARPSTWRRRRSSSKARAIAAHLLKVDRRRTQFRRGRVLHAKDQPHADGEGNRRAPPSIPPSCRKAWRPACPPPPSTPRRSRIIRTAATSANSRSTRTPARSRSCAIQRGRRRRHRAQSAAAARPDPRRHRARRRARC